MDFWILEADHQSDLDGSGRFLTVSCNLKEI
jgi:hypothetical protein